MKISLLTPTYNCGDYIERAIQSVLAQNDPDFEHIIVDGNSTDNTVEILRKYPHLKWISERDRGQSDAMNKAFDMCTGDIVTYLNADDWFEPGAFAHVRQLFEKHADADIVVGNLYVRFIGDEKMELSVPTKSYRGILLFFKYRFPLNPVSYFYRRKVQQDVGSFPLKLQYGMDYWFLLRAFSKARVLNTDLVLGTFLQTGANKTCHATPTNSVWEIVTQHLAEDNPDMRFYFYSRWYWNKWVREFPEPIKAPIRDVVYKALFSSKLSHQEFKSQGFRKSWRQCFLRQ
jgi:glycosyltransferase involved in cell wall biosynthesis